MKRVTVWKSADGKLNADLVRAVASEIHGRLPESGTNPNAKVMDWVDCLRIVENADMIEEVLLDYRELKGTDYEPE